MADDIDDDAAAPSEGVDNIVFPKGSCGHCGVTNHVMMGMAGPAGEIWYLCVLHWKDGIRTPGTQLTGVVETKPAGRDQPRQARESEKPKRPRAPRVNSQRGQ